MKNNPESRYSTMIKMMFQIFIYYFVKKYGCKKNTHFTNHGLLIFVFRSHNEYFQISYKRISRVILLIYI